MMTFGAAGKHEVRPIFLRLPLAISSTVPFPFPWLRTCLGPGSSSHQHSRRPHLGLLLLGARRDAGHSRSGFLFSTLPRVPLSCPGHIGTLTGWLFGSSHGYTLGWCFSLICFSSVVNKVVGLIPDDGRFYFYGHQILPSASRLRHSLASCPADLSPWSTPGTWAPVGTRTRARPQLNQPYHLNRSGECDSGFEGLRRVPTGLLTTDEPIKSLTLTLW